MSTSTETNILADALRAAIDDSEFTRYQLSQMSGVTQGVLSRFMAGTRDLKLETASRLAVALGMHLLPKAPAKRHGRANLEEPQQPAAGAASFTDELVALLDKLGQRSPIPGVCSLADIRPHFRSMKRQQFDAELLQLRRRGLISMSMHDGQLKLTKKEQAAGLTIDGKLYLLISSRKK